MPSVGLYFGIYSFCKKQFTNYDPECSDRRRTVYIALSAAIGNTIASASRVPYEVMKQKLQTKAYANLGDALRDMSLKTLFPTGGISSQMIRDIPYAVGTLSGVVVFFFMIIWNIVSPFFFFTKLSPPLFF